MIAAVIGFGLALAESGLGLGAVLPGEVMISTLSASADGWDATVTLGVAVALGAVAGDHLGYLIGRHGGVRMRSSRLIARIGVNRWDRAAEFVQRHGFWALFASRLLPLVRTVMPVVAGAASLRYRGFLLASVLGAGAWASLWVGTGAGLERSGILDHPTPILTALLIIVVSVLARRLVLRRRSPKNPTASSHPRSRP